MNEKMIYISLACLVFAEWSGIVAKFKWWLTWKGRLKPFDCAMCLTLWTSLFIYWGNNYGYWSILYAFANAGITVLINAIYERITAR